MEPPTFEVIAAILATATTCVAGGTVLLNWRLGAFEGKLMKDLNDVFIRRNECVLAHRSAERRLSKVENRLDSEG